MSGAKRKKKQRAKKREPAPEPLKPFPGNEPSTDDPAPIELTPNEAWEVRGLVERAGAAQQEADQYQQRAQAIAAGAAQRAGVEFSGAFRIEVDHEAGAVLVRKVDPE